MKLIEVEHDIFVDPAEVVTVESNGYWREGENPSDSHVWTKDGSRIILKNGRKVNLKIEPAKIIAILNGEKE